MYDVVIIGGGPAGITAGIYARRAMLDTLLVEKFGLGGQIALIDLVENYPGFSRVEGSTLVQRLEEHADEIELDVSFTEVERIEDRGKEKLIHTTDRSIIETRCAIIASGASPARLGIPGEKEYTGRGVSYCATCDGFFFRDRDVAIVGGGNTAIAEALFLAKMVRKIYLVHRRDALRADKILQERAFKNEKIEFVWNSVPEEIKGRETVETIVVRNVKSGELHEISVDGVFIFVGMKPETDFIECQKDERGFIKTDRSLATSISGIFAAGDCRDTPLRQIATAIGDGALAASSAVKYLEKRASTQSS
ncbi:Ferredoxin--NADP reductase [Candidatus Methanoperedenaceae archaeon GB50]|nr:Ferredoxin--NADP reductase [Candidatus Methanoperedenaceae archaeon GB50]CAD7779774.1 MAG: Ferredoxin--NADP reductase [Candidatus Methanoperedenaceae archaeon GB50]